MYTRLVVFGKQAETAAQYLKKGQSTLIEGRIQTRSWDDANGGGKKYRTEIVADSVQFGPKAGGMGTSPAANSDTAVTGTAAVKEELDTIDYGEVINPDDIPF